MLELQSTPHLESAPAAAEPLSLVRHSAFSFQRLGSVAKKELLHILRDPATLFFTLVIPIVELFMLGYAIDTNVRDIPTAVLDLARTQESRELIRDFVNTHDFKVVRYVQRDEE